LCGCVPISSDSQDARIVERPLISEFDIDDRYDVAHVKAASILYCLQIEIGLIPAAFVEF
jgi:hypothetical protein